MLDKMCAVIIIGLPGSGKSTASKTLSNSGWHIVSAGDIVRSMCIKEGLGESRKVLQSYGESLFKDNGVNYFSSLLINKAPKYGCTVFEGIRPVEVIKHMKKKLQCWVVYIESSSFNRFERLKIRDHITQYSFLKLESNSIEKQVSTMKDLANIVITNNYSLKEFDENINMFGIDAYNRYKKLEGDYPTTSTVRNLAKNINYKLDQKHG